MQTLMPERKTSPRGPGVECRVWERFPCELQTSCQPVAARADKDMLWPATVRDISAGGVGLVLRRRFERGAGLAIEVPESASYPGDTLLARVVHVRQLPEGLWLMGCSLLSELSEDGLAALLRLGREQKTMPQIELPAPSSPEFVLPSPSESAVHTRPQSNSHFLIADLDFEGTTAQGQVGTVPVRRLYLAGIWPLPTGTVLQVRLADRPKDAPGIKIRVTRCARDTDRWKVRYTFVEPPSPQLLAVFGYR